MVWAAFCITIFALVLRIASAPTASLSLIPVAIYALFGRAQAIHALFLSWLLTMLSPAISPDLGLGWAGRFVVIGAAMTSVLFRSVTERGRGRPQHLATATAALAFFLIVHSMAVSKVPGLSIAKALAWVGAMGTLFSAWTGLAPRQHFILFQILLWTLSLVLIVSLPLANSGIGYLVNGHGFQGIFYHPQSFGTAMALLGALFAGRILGTARPPFVLFLLLAVTMVCIFLSEARTAGLGMLLGLAVSLLAVPVLSRRSIWSAAPGLADRRLWIVIVFGALLSIPFSVTLVDSALGFIQKGSVGGSATSIVDAFQISRGPLVDEMLRNIEKTPLMGIGLGIASDPDTMEILREPFFGLPIAATVEKGVGPIAIVEETGVVGAIFVTGWLLMMFHWAAQSGFAGMAVVATMAATNLGEYTMFSAGGNGLLFMVLVGWACSLAGVIPGRGEVASSGAVTREAGLEMNRIDDPLGLA